MFVLFIFYLFLSRLSARNLSKSYKIFFYIFVRFDLWSPPSHLGHSSELDGSRFVVGCSSVRFLRASALIIL